MAPARDAPDHGPRTEAVTSAWSPFRHTVFRRLWIASVVANIGGWPYSAAAGWMMTGFDAGPLMVSLVQVATSLPMFLFALPAGALTDIIDKRRFILVRVRHRSTVLARFGVIGVFLWWKSPQMHPRSLPSERVIGAIRRGFRYTRNNRVLRATSG